MFQEILQGGSGGSTPVDTHDYLYNEGFLKDIAWVRTGYSYNGTGNILSIDTDSLEYCIVLKAASGNTGILGTEKTVDLTNYTTLCLEYNLTSIHGQGPIIVLNPTSKRLDTNGTFFNTIPWELNKDSVLRLTIPSTGRTNCYVGIVNGGDGIWHAYGTIKKIWVE